MQTKLVRPSSLEFVLLPGNTLTALGDDRPLGPHTVIISGFIKEVIEAFAVDDWNKKVSYIVDIRDLAWEPKFLQASSMSSWGEISSQDSDEVDHSRWGIRGVKSGHHDIAVSGQVVRFIRLRIELCVQGDMNSWRGIGFQTIANGTLSNIHDVVNRVNATEDIPDPIQKHGR